MGLKTKLLLYFELVLLIAVGTLVFMVRVQMRKQVATDMQRELSAIAMTASLQLDGDFVKSIRTPDDADTPAFRMLRQTLERIRAANGLKHEHIYTFYRDGDQVRFGVMTHPQPFVGDPYPLQPAMVRVFEKGDTAVTDLYEDAHGQWISAYAPIRDSQGNVVALLEVDKSSDQYFANYRWVSRFNVIIALVALGISSIVGWFVLDRTVIRPMDAVNGQVRALARQDFRHRVSIRTNDEFQDLGGALNRLSEQLNVARSVQQSFIPKSVPEHAGYRFAVVSEACDTTAGDYVDAFALDESRVAVLVADVTGHGLGPSLIMAACRSALRALAILPIEPREIIHRLNQMLAQDLTEGRFITMIFGILESDGTFTFCNAGHAPAMVFTRAGVAHLPAHRPPLGIEWDADDNDDTQTTMKLAPGDRILLASDGVSEAMNPAGEQYGTDRMAEIISNRTLTCEGVVELHCSALRQHCAGPQRSDDVTLLCIDRIETAGAPTTALMPTEALA